MYGYYHDLTGYVYDANNQPLPFVNVFVKEAEIGVSTDINGKYHFELQEGTYEVIFSMVGYKEQHVQITLTKDVVRNVYMQEDIQGIEAVEVRVKRRDPGFEIIKKAVKNKKKYQNQFESSTCEAYIKAGELGDEIKKEKKKPSRWDKWQKPDTTTSDTVKKITLADLPQKSFVEVQLTRHWQAPNKIKEIVGAYEERGEEDYLYYLSTTEANFDFYDNLLVVQGLTETPIISPLSITGAMAYKFKYLGSYKEDGLTINKIKVSPRATGNVLFEGTIEIIEDLWNIRRLDLRLGKGSTNMFDKFGVQQEYMMLDDSIWVLKTQQFDYQTKSGRTVFNGQTKVKFFNWVINPEFKKRFFSNELGVVTEEAYERDSSYWESIRPEPLTPEEQRFIAYTDSVRELKESEAYLDSMQAVANKVTLRKLFIDGITIVDHKKEKRIYLSSIGGMVEPFQVGGFRVGYWASYYKKFDKKRTIYLYGYPNYGFRNKDLKGSGNIVWKYDPFREGYFRIRASREFDMINPYDAYINILRRNNYFQNEKVYIANSIELFNGFYSHISTTLAHRTSVSDYKIGSLSDGFFNDNDFKDFEAHNAFYTSFGFSYSYKQKYVRQPYEKVVLGSKFPTVGMDYRKGWKGVFGSPLDFDYLEFYVRHKVKMGVGGTSQFRVLSGKFLNRDSVPLIDYKYQRMGDPVIYTDPLTTYQLLERTFPTFDWFLEGHYVHHFNGALVNKFPLIKKTRIRLVAGGGALLARDNNYRHIEAFAGAERVFKIARERFRVGLYVATSESNYTAVNGSFKVSVEYFNRKNQSWGF